MDKKRITPCKQKVIYLDNNGTTKLCPGAKKAMILWLESCANPSSDSVLAKQSKKMVEQVRAQILRHCGVKNYSVIFTSGATESNCLILRSTTDAYKKHTGKKPHIITSTIEHSSIIKCCKELKECGRASITFIEPDVFGCIRPSLVEKAITDNTAIISIMMANNEIGSVNDIKSIGEIAHRRKVPLHTDAVQIFGKYRINMKENNIDALSMSFHKLYGPMGIGLLIVNNTLIEGYDLKGQISGSQQKNLRGGTENIPSIASAGEALKCAFVNRIKKNKRMFALKKRIISKMSKELKQGDYKSYFTSDGKKSNEFLILGPPVTSYEKSRSLPNTLLISFVKNEGKSPFCNVSLKKALNKKKIIVSVGSACQTA